MDVRQGLPSSSGSTDSQSGKRKQLDAGASSSYTSGEERPAKIASPAPSREGTEHGDSRDSSIRHGIRSLDNSNRGVLSPDGTGHGMGFYSLDSSHRDVQQHDHQNDWMRQEIDVRNRQRLEKAAEALQAWSLNDRNSPAPGGSPHGSDASMGMGRGHQPMYPSMGSPQNPEDHVAAASRPQYHQQMPQAHMQQAHMSHGGGGGGGGGQGGIRTPTRL
jgi:hypothetical protein